MKIAYLLLVCSVSMLAMDELKLPGESSINWDEQTFKDAWIDPKKMSDLNNDFDLHAKFLRMCGAAEQVFKNHHHKCTCLEDETSDVNVCIRFQTFCESLYEPKEKTNTSDIPALRALLGLEQPHADGLQRYTVIRKTSYALADYTINAYLSGVDDDSNNRESGIEFSDDEKALLEQVIFPLLDKEDARHLKRLIISPVSRLGSLRKIDAGYNSPIVPHKISEEYSQE